MTNAVDIAQMGSNNVTFRNKIINGAMVFDQRNAGAALTGISSSVYCLDRWKFDIGGTGTFTLQQSSTAPTGFSNSLAITCTAATASPGVLYADQKIEGFNLQDLAYNTASASSVTVSFWVRSNKTGTFVALLYNTSATRMVGRTYTISTANTWEQKTVTFPGDTAAAIPNSNANGLEIRFWLAAGSTWSSGTLPTTWATDVTANQAAGQTVNLADTIGNTFYITGVQLEAGTTASPFEYRQYGTELQLCQRYYQKFNGSQYLNESVGAAAATTVIYYNKPFITSMRTAPTFSSRGTFNADGTSYSTVTLTMPYASTETARVDGAGSGFTAGQAYGLTHQSTNSYLQFTAEL